jgi:hypothetical protein
MALHDEYSTFVRSSPGNTEQTLCGVWSVRCAIARLIAVGPRLCLFAVEEYYGAITHTRNTDWSHTQMTGSERP